MPSQHEPSPEGQGDIMAYCVEPYRSGLLLHPLRCRGVAVESGSFRRECTTASPALTQLFTLRPAVAVYALFCLRRPADDFAPWAAGWCGRSLRELRS